jgi:hypothetical protein
MTKKTVKTNAKKQAAEKHDEKAVPQKGRVHTIAKPTDTAPDAATIEATPQRPDDASEIVVFAFRLTRSERDEIHAATGSAKASKFIRTLALAGARGDMKAVQETIDEVHATSR